jgi:RHS repeat-associated protein
MSWSAAGNQTFSRTYTYDVLNRIGSMADTASGQACKGLSWTIDAWGNMTAQNYTAGSCYTFSAAVGTNNQLQTGYQYDAAGNMTYDGTHHYTYDAENRITQVDSGSTASYVYNENGKRVRKNTGSTWTEYLYGPNGSVQSEYNGSAWPAQYVYAGDKLIAEYTSSTTEFIHVDHLGSTRLVTAVNGTVTDNLDYYPFGLQSAGDTSTTHKFTGKERDAESNLDMFVARYYGSSLGRFMTPDWAAKPISVPYANFGNPQSLNLYSYVENNPLTLIDDDGHDIIYADNLKNAQVVKDSVQAILADPHTSANLSGYVGKDNPNLTIQSGDLSAGDTRTVSPDGQTVTTTTVQGNTAPDIQTSTITSNGVTSAPETILTGATITIDNRTSKGDTPGVMVHESVHAGEAKADPAKFSKDAAAEKSNPNHDARPQEQRANAAQQAYGKEIKQAVKQIEKDRKKDNQ